MTSWTEPIVRWRTGIDSSAHHRWLVERGELLATWPPAPFEEADTNCFRVDQEYWIWQLGVGGICFFGDQAEFLACPSAQVEPQWFEHLVTRSWLPAVYPFWGRQVLHASAAARSATREVVAFTGPSCAGKSTMAYGLAKRRGWNLVCDDTLAFSSIEAVDGRETRVHRLNSVARLRPSSAAFYGQSDVVPESVDWSARSLDLKAVYFLHGDPAAQRPVEITRLRVAAAYPLLLEQAHAATLMIPEQNQRLMRDYLELAAAVPVFRLDYRRSFDSLEEIFAAVENHLPTADSPVRSTLRTDVLV